MQLRAVAAFLTVLSLTVSASAVTPGKFSDPAVLAAASRMKAKDYHGAREAALNGADKGVRAFLVGLCDERLELFEESAAQLGYAAETFPLLADYALHHQALALSRLKRHEEALAPLQRLVRNHAGSRLVRPSLLLIADSLYGAGRYREALDSYTAFIERYPQGSDSLNALYFSALTREKLRDFSGAVTTLRGIWISHPSSTVAQKAAEELAQLAKETPVPPYSAAELYKRGNTLYDLGQFAKAARAYEEILGKGDADFNGKVRLKLGQALVKAKRYQEAQEALQPLVQKGATPAGEAWYWYARALEKSGKSEGAFAIYQSLAGGGGAVANDALLDAAYLKRSEGRREEAVRLFQNFLSRNPDSPKRPAVIWEAAWNSYQTRDYKTALDYLTLLSQYRETREKALYWLGRTQVALGDQKGAELNFTQLRTDFPFGYYALLCNQGCVQGEPPRPPANLASALPLPAGFEREKALIALGLHDEAARELSALKRQRHPLGLARLYLEMENFNGAYNLLQQEQPKTGEQESAALWGLSYPLAFREHVSQHAGAQHVPESLIYAIMRSESNFHPGARSPVGALGLMQMMPATAEAISKGGTERLTTPEFNIRLGTKHLKDLLDTYSGNIALTAAAYNAGGGNVKRWQKSYGALPQDEFIESIPFKETRDYVKKVATAMALYQKMYDLAPVPPVAGPKVLTAASR